MAKGVRLLQVLAPGPRGPPGGPEPSAWRKRPTGFQSGGGDPAHPRRPRGELSPAQDAGVFINSQPIRRRSEHMTRVNDVLRLFSSSVRGSTILGAPRKPKRPSARTRLPGYPGPGPEIHGRAGGGPGPVGGAGVPPPLPPPPPGLGGVPARGAPAPAAQPALRARGSSRQPGPRGPPPGVGAVRALGRRRLGAPAAPRFPR
ncbi:cuticle collagen 2-like, partial [Mustela erminea]|uniref:cuticle collagen 2-like n=1 Tax=Mustela erminea TaxID=36723 RepID=UPI00138689DF